MRPTAPFDPAAPLPHPPPRPGLVNCVLFIARAASTTLTWRAECASPPARPVVGLPMYTITIGHPTEPGARPAREKGGSWGCGRGRRLRCA
jgi:hypothetical protein